MAYKFVKTIDPTNAHDKTNVVIQLPHNEMSLEDLLEAFQEFLLACGYKFDGTVDITSDSE